MRKGIFRRIFLAYAAVFLLATAFVEIYITAAVRDSYINNMEEHLSNEINLISKIVSFDKTGIDDLCRMLKKDSSARVTIILGDGRVIGDSDHDSTTMENHANRTEVQQALLRGAGAAIRHSDTLNYDLLYVAKKIIRDSGEEGFIRLAVPLKDIDMAVNLLRMKIILVMLAVLFAAWAVPTWQTNHLRRLLKQITGFSRSLSRGEIDKRLFLENAGEFNEIADNLTSMSAELQAVMDQNEAERKRLEVVLRSVPDALLIIDSKGIITLSSSSAKGFFGNVPMTQVHFAEVVRNHEFADLLEDVRKDRLPGMTAFRIESPEEKFLRVRVSPLFYKKEDELSGFVAVFHDITQIEKLEQVRKDFVANVSHEIKTPVTAIKGFADTLLEGALDDKENAARFVQTIKSNSERINSLVDDLMTISKIELGAIKVEKTAVDLDEVFESIIDIFREKASSRNLSLKVSQKPEVKHISADRNRLIQILTNLVDNALKFTETGGVTFGVDTDGEKTFLFVEDSGIGVPPKHLARLGERFYRVDPARSRKLGGTGLGLAIVKHLVKAHGWTMQIASVPGKGTTVRVFI